jgi:threonine aldolase
MSLDKSINSMINLISDTVTKPTQGMLQAMMAAPVGDDVFDSDPTVNLLQEKIADLFGTEAALFCASGTMTNQIALKVHTQPGDEVICHHYAHIYNYEGGGMMFNSGLSPRLVGDSLGHITAADVGEVISNPNDIHAARTKLITAENTSNKGGGTCANFDDLKEIGKVARQHNLGYHLDGARLFNAMAVTGEKPRAYGQLFDSISICLSKGLGCPIGSLLLGDKSFITDAKRIRKRFGGAWRQAGYLAAAGIYALDHHIERLSEDHDKAKKLADCLATLPFVATVVAPQTNIVIFTLTDKSKSEVFMQEMKKNGIAMISMGQGKLRMVTHLNISEAEIDKVCQVLKILKF